MVFGIQGKPVEVFKSTDYSGMERAMDWSSTEHTTLAEMETGIGKEQAIRRKLEFTLSWILEEAVWDEMECNWKKWFQIVNGFGNQTFSNTVTSRLFFEIRKKDWDVAKLMVPLCPHSNRDGYNISASNDSENFQLPYVFWWVSLSYWNSETPRWRFKY